MFATGTVVASIFLFFITGVSFSIQFYAVKTVQIRKILILSEKQYVFVKIIDDEWGSVLWSIPPPLAGLNEKER